MEPFLLRVQSEKLAMTEKPTYEELERRVAELEQQGMELKRTEEMLRENEELVKATMNSTADGILAVNSGGHVIQVNTRFIQMWRIPHDIVQTGNDERLLNYVLDQLMEPEDFLSKVMALYGSLKEDVDTLLFKDGRIFERFSLPIIKEGKIAGRVWSFRDTTERDRAEKALKETQDRYRRITDAVTDYIYTVHIRDGQPTQTIHRPGCVAVTGFTPEDFSGNPYLWFDMVHDEDREAVRAHARDVLTGKTSEPLEHRIVRKDRAIRWVRNTPVPHYDESGKLLSYDGLIQDITELKHAQEMARYKELFENVVDGVFILGSEGRFVELNDMVCQKTGFTREELLKLGLKDIVVGEQIPFLMETIERIKHEKEVSFEIDVQSKNRDRIPFETNCRMISYLGKDCILGVSRDVTQARLLQDQLIRSERLAATGQLAASIAHEINSPLQGVTALLNVMRKTYNDNEQLANDINLVKSAFDNIGSTVRKLLDLNRPGNERKQPVNVNRIIEDTVTLVRGHLKQNKIQMELRLSPRVPNLIASPQQLGQVFMNLINNAVEAITGVSKRNGPKKAPPDAQEIAIDTSLRKGMVVIKVADTGPGIAEEDLKRIFDPFYTKKKSMGMGIGLSICHGVIEEHKGTIGVRNSPKGGAVFTITLPAT
jgi:PAS domain S-box-containing protein